MFLSSVAVIPPPGLVRSHKNEPTHRLESDDETNDYTDNEIIISMDLVSVRF
jgi:hypothetical protein